MKKNSMLLYGQMHVILLVHKFFTKNEGKRNVLRVYRTDRRHQRPTCCMAHPQQEVLQCGGELGEREVLGLSTMKRGGAGDKHGETQPELRSLCCH